MSRSGQLRTSSHDLSQMLRRLLCAATTSPAACRRTRSHDQGPANQRTQSTFMSFHVFSKYVQNVISFHVCNSLLEAISKNMWLFSLEHCSSAPLGSLAWTFKIPSLKECCFKEPRKKKHSFTLPSTRNEQDYVEDMRLPATASRELAAAEIPSPSKQHFSLAKSRFCSSVPTVARKTNPELSCSPVRGISGTWNSWKTSQKTRKDSLPWSFQTVSSNAQLWGMDIWASLLQTQYVPIIPLGQHLKGFWDENVKLIEY